MPAPPLRLPGTVMLAGAQGARLSTGASRLAATTGSRDITKPSFADPSQGSRVRRLYPSHEGSRGRADPQRH